LAGRATPPREIPRLMLDPAVNPLRLIKRWGTAWVRAVTSTRAL
jgi:hypothetical protein